MISIITKRKSGIFFKGTAWLALFAFAASLILPVPYVQAQTLLNLPAPGTMVPPSPGFTPPIIKGITLHPDDPLKFDFIVDRGDDPLSMEDYRQEASKLIKYFLASLTVPEEELWVNLSPNEADRIIPNSFGQTEMGRDLLAQDYILKQLTASLMYPEDEVGQKFWARVRAKAKAQFGTIEVPMNTFNKVWIVPEKAVVYTNGNSAFVVDSYLKVMLEEDYLAMSREQSAEGREQSASVQTEIIKEILIPEIEREVNEGKNFANLRQIFYSMILATWYKKNLKQSILSKVYVDKNLVEGVEVDDKEITNKIYDQYIEAFKKGVYDYIKEEYDADAQAVIPRKYFSGGAAMQRISKDMATTSEVDPRFLADRELDRITAGIVATDVAMAGGEAERERLIRELQGAVITDQVHAVVEGMIAKINREFPKALEAVSIIEDSSYNYGVMLRGSDLDGFHVFVRGLPTEQMEAYEAELDQQLEALTINMPQRPVFIDLDEVEKEIREKGKRRLRRELDSKIDVEYTVDLEVLDEDLPESSMSPLDFTFTARNYGSVYGNTAKLLERIISDQKLKGLDEDYRYMYHVALRRGSVNKQPMRMQIFGKEASDLRIQLSTTELKAVLALENTSMNQKTSVRLSQKTLDRLKEQGLISPIRMLDAAYLYAKIFPYDHIIAYHLAWRNERDFVFVKQTHPDAKYRTLVGRYKEIPSDLTVEARKFIESHLQSTEQMLRIAGVSSTGEVVGKMGTWHKVYFYGVGIVGVRNIPKLAVHTGQDIWIGDYNQHGVLEVYIDADFYSHYDESMSRKINAWLLKQGEAVEVNRGKVLKVPKSDESMLSEETQTVINSLVRFSLFTQEERSAENFLIFLGAVGIDIARAAVTVETRGSKLEDVLRGFGLDFPEDMRRVYDRVVNQGKGMADLSFKTLLRIRELRESLGDDDVFSSTPEELLSYGRSLWSELDDGVKQAVLAQGLDPDAAMEAAEDLNPKLDRVISALKEAESADSLALDRVDLSRLQDWTDIALTRDDMIRNMQIRTAKGVARGINDAEALIEALDAVWLHLATIAEEAPRERLEEIVSEAKDRLAEKFEAADFHDPNAERARISAVKERIQANLPAIELSRKGQLEVIITYKANDGKLVEDLHAVVEEYSFDEQLNRYTLKIKGKSPITVSADSEKDSDDIDGYNFDVYLEYQSVYEGINEVMLLWRDRLATYGDRLQFKLDRVITALDRLKPLDAHPAWAITSSVLGTSSYTFAQLMQKVAKEIIDQTPTEDAREEVIARAKGYLIKRHQALTDPDAAMEASDAERTNRIYAMEETEVGRKIRGHYIRWLRLNKGWSPLELASHAQSTKGTVEKIEEGQIVRISTISRFANTLFSNLGWERYAEGLFERIEEGKQLLGVEAFTLEDVPRIIASWEWPEEPVKKKRRSQVGIAITDMENITLEVLQDLLGDNLPHAAVFFRYDNDKEWHEVERRWVVRQKRAEEAGMTMLMQKELRDRILGTLPDMPGMYDLFDPRRDQANASKPAIIATTAQGAISLRDRYKNEEERRKLGIGDEDVYIVALVDEKNARKLSTELAKSEKVDNVHVYVQITADKALDLERKLVEAAQDAAMLSNRSLAAALAAAITVCVVCGDSREEVIPGKQGVISREDPTLGQMPGRDFSVEDVERREHAKLFGDYLEEIVAELEASGDPAVAAAQAFRDVARKELIYITSKSERGVRIAGVGFKVTGEKGKETINIALMVNIDIIPELVRRAKEDPFFKKILLTTIIKEGAMLADMFANPDYYVQIDRVRKEFGEKSVDADDPEFARRTKRAAATIVEAEAVGYIAELEYLHRNGITMEQIETYGARESDPLIAAKLYLLYRLMDRVVRTKAAEHKDLHLRMDLFLEHIGPGHPELGNAIIDIGIKEGTITVSDDGYVMGTREALEFLIKPEFVGREPARLSEEITGKEDAAMEAEDDATWVNQVKYFDTTEPVDLGEVSQSLGEFRFFASQTGYDEVSFSFEGKNLLRVDIGDEEGIRARVLFEKRSDTRVRVKAEVKGFESLDKLDAMIALAEGILTSDAAMLVNDDIKRAGRIHEDTDIKFVYQNKPRPGWEDDGFRFELEFDPDARYEKGLVTLELWDAGVKWGKRARSSMKYYERELETDPEETSSGVTTLLVRDTSRVVRRIQRFPGNIIPQVREQVQTIIGSEDDAMFANLPSPKVLARAIDEVVAKIPEEYRPEIVRRVRLDTGHHQSRSDHKDHRPKLIIYYGSEQDTQLTERIKDYFAKPLVAKLNAESRSQLAMKSSETEVLYKTGERDSTAPQTIISLRFTWLAGLRSDEETYHRLAEMIIDELVKHDHAMAGALTPEEFYQKADRGEIEDGAELLLLKKHSGTIRLSFKGVDTNPADAQEFPGEKYIEGTLGDGSPRRVYLNTLMGVAADGSMLANDFEEASQKYGIELSDLVEVFIRHALVDNIIDEMPIIATNRSIVADVMENAKVAQREYSGGPLVLTPDFYTKVGRLTLRLEVDLKKDVGRPQMERYIIQGIADQDAFDKDLKEKGLRGISGQELIEGWIARRKAEIAGRDGGSDAAMLVTPVPEAERAVPVVNESYGISVTPVNSSYADRQMGRIAKAVALEFPEYISRVTKLRSRIVITYDSNPESERLAKLAAKVIAAWNMSEVHLGDKPTTTEMTSELTIGKPKDLPFHLALHIRAPNNTQSEIAVEMFEKGKTASESLRETVSHRANISTTNLAYSRLEIGGINYFLIPGADGSMLSAEDLQADIEMANVTLFDLLRIHYRDLKWVEPNKIEEVLEDMDATDGDVFINGRKIRWMKAENVFDVLERLRRYQENFEFFVTHERHIAFLFVEGEVSREIGPAIKELDHESPRVRIAAAKKLGEYPHPLARKALLKNLFNEDAKVKQAIILALERIGDESAINPLVILLSTEADFTTQTLINRTLKSLGYNPPEKVWAGKDEYWWRTRNRHVSFMENSNAVLVDSTPVGTTIRALLESEPAKEARLQGPGWIFKRDRIETLREGRVVRITHRYHVRPEVLEELGKEGIPDKIEITDRGLHQPVYEFVIPEFVEFVSDGAMTAEEYADGYRDGILSDEGRYSPRDRSLGEVFYRLREELGVNLRHVHPTFIGPSFTLFTPGGERIFETSNTYLILDPQELYEALSPLFPVAQRRVDQIKNRILPGIFALSAQRWAAHQYGNPRYFMQFLIDNLSLLKQGEFVTPEAQALKNIVDIGYDEKTGIGDPDGGKTGFDPLDRGDVEFIRKKIRELTDPTRVETPLDAAVLKYREEFFDRLVESDEAKESLIPRVTEIFRGIGLIQQTNANFNQPEYSLSFFARTAQGLIRPIIREMTANPSPQELEYVGARVQAVLEPYVFQTYLSIEFQKRPQIRRKLVEIIDQQEDILGVRFNQRGAGYRPERIIDNVQAIIGIPLTGEQRMLLKALASKEERAGFLADIILRKRVRWRKARKLQPYRTSTGDAVYPSKIWRFHAQLLGAVVHPWKGTWQWDGEMYAPLDAIAIAVSRSGTEIIRQARYLAPDESITFSSQDKAGGQRDILLSHEGVDFKTLSARSRMATFEHENPFSLIKVEDIRGETEEYPEYGFVTVVHLSPRNMQLLREQGMDTTIDITSQLTYRELGRENIFPPTPALLVFKESEESLDRLPEEISTGYRNDPDRLNGLSLLQVPKAPDAKISVLRERQDYTELGADVVEKWDQHYATFEIRNDVLGYVLYVSIHRLPQIESQTPEFNRKHYASGGLRKMHYPGGETAALATALRLSRAMSYKNASAELKIGGGKAVGHFWGIDPANPKDNPEKRDAISRDIAHAVKHINRILDGGFIMGPDMNTTNHDMQVMNAAESNLVTPIYNMALNAHASPRTAEGVLQAIQTALWFSNFSTKGIRGKVFGVQGVGDVGRLIVNGLLEKDGIVIASDIDPKKVEQILEANQDAVWEGRFFAFVEDPTDDGRYTQRILHPLEHFPELREELRIERMNVFVPNAGEDVLNDESIPILKEAGYQLIVGAANDQLEEPEVHAQALSDWGIIYVPDYAVNLGGITAVTGHLGHSITYEAIRSFVRQKVMNLLTVAQERGPSATPQEVADDFSEAFIKENFEGEPHAPLPDLAMNAADEIERQIRSDPANMPSVFHSVVGEKKVRRVLGDGIEWELSYLGGYEVFVREGERYRRTDWREAERIFKGQSRRQRRKAALFISEDLDQKVAAIVPDAAMFSNFLGKRNVNFDTHDLQSLRGYYPTIKLAMIPDANGILRIKVDRQHFIPTNGLLMQMRHDLIQIIKRAQGDDRIRGIILSGTGISYIAGGDLEELLEQSNEEAAENMRLGQELAITIEQSTKPVVTIIHGYAVGGGAHTALATHGIVMSERAAILHTELSLFLLPPWGAIWRLPRIVGIENTLKLFATPSSPASANIRIFPAQEAKEMGYVDVVTDKDLQQEAMALIERLIREDNVKPRWQRRMQELGGEQSLAQAAADLFSNEGAGQTLGALLEAQTAVESKHGIEGRVALVNEIARIMQLSFTEGPQAADLAVQEYFRENGLSLNARKAVVHVLDSERTNKNLRSFHLKQIEALRAEWASITEIDEKILEALRDGINLAFEQGLNLNGIYFLGRSEKEHNAVIVTDQGRRGRITQILHDIVDERVAKAAEVEISEPEEMEDGSRFAIIVDKAMAAKKEYSLTPYINMIDSRAKRGGYHKSIHMHRDWVDFVDLAESEEGERMFAPLLEAMLANERVQKEIAAVDDAKRTMGGYIFYNIYRLSQKDRIPMSEIIATVMEFFQANPWFPGSLDADHRKHFSLVNTLNEILHRSGSDKYAVERAMAGVRIFTQLVNYGWLHPPFSSINILFGNLHLGTETTTKKFRFKVFSVPIDRIMNMEVLGSLSSSNPRLTPSQKFQLAENLATAIHPKDPHAITSEILSKLDEFIENADDAMTAADNLQIVPGRVFVIDKRGQVEFVEEARKKGIPVIKIAIRERDGEEFINPLRAQVQVSPDESRELYTPFIDQSEVERLLNDNTNLPVVITEDPLVLNRYADNVTVMRDFVERRMIRDFRTRTMIPSLGRRRNIEPGSVFFVNFNDKTSQRQIVSQAQEAGLTVLRPSEFGSHAELLEIRDGNVEPIKLVSLGEVEQLLDRSESTPVIVGLRVASIKNFFRKLEVKENPWKNRHIIYYRRMLQEARRFEEFQDREVEDAPEEDPDLAMRAEQTWQEVKDEPISALDRTSLMVRQIQWRKVQLGDEVFELMPNIISHMIERGKEGLFEKIPIHLYLVPHEYRVQSFEPVVVIEANAEGISYTDQSYQAVRFDTWEVRDLTGLQPQIEQILKEAEVNIFTYVILERAKKRMRQILFNVGQKDLAISPQLGPQLDWDRFNGFLGETLGLLERIAGQVAELNRKNYEDALEDLRELRNDLAMVAKSFDFEIKEGDVERIEDFILGDPQEFISLLTDIIGEAPTYSHLQLNAIGDRLEMYFAGLLQIEIIYRSHSKRLEINIKAKDIRELENAYNAVVEALGVDIPYATAEGSVLQYKIPFDRAMVAGLEPETYHYRLDSARTVELSYDPKEVFIPEDGRQPIDGLHAMAWLLEGVTTKRIIGPDGQVLEETKHASNIIPDEKAMRGDSLKLADSMPVFINNVRSFPWADLEEERWDITLDLEDESLDVGGTVQPLIDYLEKEAENPDAEIRQAAYQFLIELSIYLLKLHEKHENATFSAEQLMYLRSLQESPLAKAAQAQQPRPQAVRQAILEAKAADSAMAGSIDPRVLEVQIRNLQDENPRIRDRGVRFFRDHGSAEHAPLLVDMIDREIRERNHTLLTSLAIALGYLDNLISVEPLKNRLLTYPYHYKVRLNAARSLGHLQANDAVQDLMKQYQQEEYDDARREILLSLGGIGGLGVRDFLINALDDGSVKVQKAAATALKIRGDPSAIPALEMARAHERREAVRIKITEAIIALQAAGADDAMLSALQDALIEYLREKAQGEADFGIVKALLQRVDPDFDIRMTDDEISRMTFADFMILLNRIRYEVLIPGNIDFRIVGQGPSGEAVIQRTAVFSQEDWRTRAYLGQSIWVAKAHFGGDGVDHISSYNAGWFVFQDADLSREEAARYVADLMESESPGLFGASLRDFIENQSMEVSTYVEKVASHIHSSFNFRLAEDEAFAMMNTGIDHRLVSDLQTPVYKAIVKSTSRLHPQNIIETPDGRLLLSGGGLGEEFVAKGVTLLAARLGGIIQLMNELSREDPALAFMAFLDFMGQREFYKTIPIELMTGDATEAAERFAAEEIFNVIRELLAQKGESDFYAYLFEKGNLEVRTRNALKLLEDIYALHFWTDKERLGRKKEGVTLPDPSFDGAMVAGGDITDRRDNRIPPPFDQSPYKEKISGILTEVYEGRIEEPLARRKLFQLRAEIDDRKYRLPEGWIREIVSSAIQDRNILVNSEPAVDVTEEDKLHTIEDIIEQERASIEASYHEEIEAYGEIPEYSNPLIRESSEEQLRPILQRVGFSDSFVDFSLRLLSQSSWWKKASDPEESETYLSERAFATSLGDMGAGEITRLPGMFDPDAPIDQPLRDTVAKMVAGERLSPGESISVLLGRRPYLLPYVIELVSHELPEVSRDAEEAIAFEIIENLVLEKENPQPHALRVLFFGLLEMAWRMMEIPALGHESTQLYDRYAGWTQVAFHALEMFGSEDGLDGFTFTEEEKQSLEKASGRLSEVNVTFRPVSPVEYHLRADRLYMGMRHGHTESLAQYLVRGSPYDLPRDELERELDILFDSLERQISRENPTTRANIREFLEFLGEGIAILQQPVEDETLLRRLADLRQRLEDGAMKGDLDEAIELLVHPEWEIRRLGVLDIEKDGGLEHAPLLVGMVERELREGNDVLLQNIAHALGVLGNPVAFNVLANQLLEHDKSGVREDSAEALGNIDVPEVVPRLIRAAKDDRNQGDRSNSVRRAIATSLGQHRDEQGVDTLIHMLDDSDPEVVWRAIRSLGQIGALRAAGALEKKANDPDIWIREKVEEALQRIEYFHEQGRHRDEKTQRLEKKASEFLIRNFSDHEDSLHFIEQLERRLQLEKGTDSPEILRALWLLIEAGKKILITRVEGFNNDHVLNISPLVRYMVAELNGGEYPARDYLLRKDLVDQLLWLSLTKEGREKVKSFEQADGLTTLRGQLTAFITEIRIDTAMVGIEELVILLTDMSWEYHAGVFRVGGILSSTLSINVEKENGKLRFYKYAGQKEGWSKIEVDEIEIGEDPRVLFQEFKRMLSKDSLTRESREKLAMIERVVYLEPENKEQSPASEQDGAMVGEKVFYPLDVADLFVLVIRRNQDILNENAGDLERLQALLRERIPPEFEEKVDEPLIGAMAALIHNQQLDAIGELLLRHNDSKEGRQRYVEFMVRKFGFDEESRKLLVVWQDAAQIAAVPGGIDLNPQNWELDAQGSEIEIKMPVNLPDLESMDIKGFTPVIFQIVPITNIPLLLGLTDEEDPTPLADRPNRIEQLTLKR